MQKVTLKFTSLHDLGECLFMLSVQHPSIDYSHISFTADLSEEQIERSKHCGGIIVVDDSYTIEPETDNQDY